MADWDLYAVVRSCKSATNTASAAVADGKTEEEDPLACLASLKFEEENDGLFSFPYLVESKNTAFQELQQLCNPFFSNPTTTTTTTTTTTSTNLGVIPDSSSISEIAGCGGQQHHFLNTNSTINGPSFLPPGSYISGFEEHAQHRPKLEQQSVQKEAARDHLHPQQGLVFQRPISSSQTPRSRKRKSLQKKMVCQVTAENLSGDLWAWRKYGQKPIKGSPYPRNYYRCSSSKGCAARKQVERSNADPNMFIVTYTGDHTHPRPTHRNSLAGSTRSKFAASQKQTLSPTTPLSTAQNEEAEAAPANNKLPEDEELEMEDEDRESEEENEDLIEDGDILIPNMAMSEDIFLGLQQLGCSSSSTSTASNSAAISKADDFSDQAAPPGLGSCWGGSNASSSAPAGATVGGGC